MTNLDRLNSPMQEEFVKEWREAKMKEGYEKANLLSLFIDSHANLINDYARDYANKRLSTKKKGEIIDGMGIFNCTTSSQAMTFNLFCPFIEMLDRGLSENVSSIFSRLFPCQEIKEVINIDLEYYPQDLRENLFDTGAMDAIVWYLDQKAQRGFISFEIKYNEKLGRNETDLGGFIKIIKKLSLFTSEWEQMLMSRKQSSSQIYRNYVLAEAFAREGKYPNHLSVVLALNQNEEVVVEVQSFRNKLRDKNTITFLSIQNFISKTLELCDKQYIYLFEKFYHRYLDFPKLTSIENIRSLLKLESERYEKMNSIISGEQPKGQAYAYFPEGDLNYRWGEFIQVGHSTNIIGNVCLLQPNQKERGIIYSGYSPMPEEGFNCYEIEIDIIHENIIKLFYERHISLHKNDKIAGIIQIFYLNNNMHLKRKEVKSMNTTDILSDFTFKDYAHILKLQEKDVFKLPTYIGWGCISYKDSCYQEAEQIFNKVLIHNNYLYKSFDQNKFIGPRSVMDKMSLNENILSTRYRFVTGDSLSDF